MLAIHTYVFFQMPYYAMAQLLRNLPKDQQLKTQ
jgi:hypothetical protein